MLLVGIEITNPFESPSLLTEEDKQAIAIARQEANNGNWVEGSVLFDNIHKKY